MTAPRVFFFAIAATLAAPLAGCGYHHIGTTPVAVREEAPTKPQPQRVVAPKDDTVQAPSAYFPLKLGTVFTYTRTYADQGYVGTRVMTVSSADYVNNQLAGTTDEMMSLAFTGHVTQAKGRLTVDLPDFPNVHTLESFVLKDGLKVNASWDAEIDGRAWNFVVRKSDKVTVAAGSYDCLVVEAATRSAVLGTVTITKQTLYFAAGVGLVKAVLKVDEQGDKALISHEMTEELKSVK